MQIYTKKIANLGKPLGKKDTSKWRDIPCSWLGRFKIAKTTILPQLSLTLSTIPIKIPSFVFVYLLDCFELVKMILKFIWKNKGEQSESLWSRRVVRQVHALRDTEM